MRRFLPLILVFAFVGTAAADIPDEENSSCEPWDTNGCAFITPGLPSEGKSAIDCITVNVRNSDNDPIEGVQVDINFSNCTGLCWCDPPMESSGLTGPDGTTVICFSGGGCEQCTVIVRADGVTICTYQDVRSTDWDGSACDGIVGGSDFAFFATAFKVTQDPCADYNCDGSVGGIDFSMFAISFSAGDACPP
jgi:hypothetical protein